MARSRAKTKGRREGGRFFQVPHSVVKTPAFLALTAHAQKLWYDLMLQYNGSNNGRIVAVLSQMEARGWSNGTLYRSLQELLGKGFLEKTRQGGIGAMAKTCTYYRFTHLPTGTDPEIPLRAMGPTNEFRSWNPARE